MTQKDILESIIRIEILAFFQANPHTRDTAEGLAPRLHRSTEAVKKACETLVTLGVLHTNNSSRNNIYCLKNRELIQAHYQNSKSEGYILDMEKPLVNNGFDFTGGKL